MKWSIHNRPLLAGYYENPKQAEKARNRRSIADAILTIQNDSEAVTVLAVARTAGVDPGTVRNNRDLHDEIKQLRGAQQPQLARASSIPSEEVASNKEMRARWKLAQGEVIDLRRQLKEVRRSAHQALGAAPPTLDPAIIEDMKDELTQIRVELMESQQDNADLHEQSADLAQELTDAKELNREYFRRINQIESGQREVRKSNAATKIRN